MRMAGTFCTNTLAPRTLATFGRSWRTTSSADLRWLNGFRLMVMRPVLSELEDRKSTRLNSSHSQISYAVFCLKKKKKKYNSITRKKLNIITQLIIQI